MNRSIAACLLAAGALVLMLVLVMTPSPALAQAGPPPPAVKTQFTFTTLQVMDILGGNAYDGWDLGLAQGTCIQAFGDRQVTGKILDLGAMKLSDGATYPILVVEGQALLHELADGAGARKIEKVSSAQNLVLVPKEKIWTAADGRSSVSLVEGLCFIVLAPDGFPQSGVVVVGVADSKTLYAYPK
jgi:hypothetical protein